MAVSHHILEVVGRPLLASVVEDCSAIIAGGVAICEEAGDVSLYLDPPETGWCALLCGGAPSDGQASRGASPRRPGRWLCHEDGCGLAQRCIRTRAPAEAICRGGRSLRAVPIVARDQVVGTIVYGYGPPRVAPRELPALAAMFEVELEQLRRAAPAETDTHQSETMLRAAMRHIETIALLLGELVERKGQEHERGRLRELFIATLGHDLRSPLSAIMLAADRIAAGEASADILGKRILHSGGRIARMIDELLDFTQLRLGGGAPLQAAEVDLRSLAEETVGELLVAHPQGTVEVSGLGRYLVSCDPNRIARVLGNLIGNALAHGEKGAPVDVRIARENREAVISVHNRGPPIAADLLPRIFEPFEHRETNRHPGGLGLGLYIAREIVEQHRGSIEVASTAGAGTTFVVRIPEGSRDARW